MNEQQKQQRWDELQKLKEINLVDFAVNVYKYTVDEKKTNEENRNIENARYVFLDSPDGDKFLVSRVNEEGKNIYLFKNIFNEGIKGNIFSLIKFEEDKKGGDSNYSIPYCKKKISAFLYKLDKGDYKTTNLLFNNKQDLSNVVSVSSLEKVAKSYQRLPDITNRTFLHSKGISDDMIDSPCLKDRIKNETIYTEGGQGGKITYINTVFPIYAIKDDKQYLCSYVRQSENFKWHKMNKADSYSSIGVWASNYNNDKVLDNLILAENPRDSISYAYMKTDFHKDNNLLLASNGQITESQIAIYQKLITELEPTNIILAYDNCCAGQRFNAQILCALKLSEKYTDELFAKNNELISSADVHCGLINQHNGQIVWKFSHNENVSGMTQDEFLLEHIPQFKRVLDYYTEKNHEYVFELDEKLPFKIDKVFFQNHSEIKVSFNNSKDNWTKITESLHALKFDYSENLKIEVAKNKDWNEDLQEAKGLIEVEKKNDISKDNDVFKIDKQISTNINF